MKKLVALAIAIGSLTTTVFAQPSQRNNDRPNNRYDDHNKEAVYNNTHRDYDPHATVYNNPQRNGRDQRADERARQEEMSRMNRDYDRRINDYRNDRSLPSYERDRRIAEAERERKEKAKSFGGGVVVGAIAGVLLGVLIAK